MMPMTPSGTRTRSILRPLGRVQLAITSPMGSGSAAMSSSPLAMASTRLASRLRRSRNAAVGRPSRAAARSRSLASSSAAVCARISAAAARSAVLLASAEASASRCAASRARRPIAAITSATLSAARGGVGPFASRRPVLLAPALDESRVASLALLRAAMSLTPPLRRRRRRLDCALRERAAAWSIRWGGGVQAPSARPSAPVQDHVVAMDQRRPAGKAQDGGNLAAAPADDALRFLPRIGDEPAAELPAVVGADEDGIPALEVAADARHAGRQEALARRQGPLGAGVDLEEALGLELAGDPALAGGDRVGGCQQPRAGGAGLQPAQRVLHRARGDHHVRAGRQRDLAGLDLRDPAAARELAGSTPRHRL